MAMAFRLWLAQPTLGSVAQVFELFGFQFADFSGLEVEHQRPVADTADFLDMMAYLFEHLAQFAIAPFNQNYFEPRIVALADPADLRRSSMHPSGAWLLAIDANALAQAVQFFFRGL